MENEDLETRKGILKSNLTFVKRLIPTDSLFSSTIVQIREGGLFYG
jgi:hypothetical protein